MTFNSNLYLLIIIMRLNVNYMNKLCEDGLFDSITQLQNGTIVIFRDTLVWFLTERLVGPFHINKTFGEMNGPIDSVVTIDEHNSITEFDGSSLYMDDKNYYTYKNIRPFEVEWGSLIYLPHTGLKASIGSHNKTIEELMSRKMLASYYDWHASRVRFVFIDSTVLGFNFSLGVEYSDPELSDISTELKKYGIEETVKFNAAFSQKVNDVYKLYLFSVDRYCLIEMQNQTKQSCVWNPSQAFLKCKEFANYANVTTVVTNHKKVTTFPTASNNNKNNKNSSNDNKVMNKTPDIPDLDAGSVHKITNGSKHLIICKSIVLLLVLHIF